jgi:hypothetical protein
MVFEIGKKGNKTQLRFTHLGLVPDYECYEMCRDGWSNYIQNSLRSLIATGKGQPNDKGKPKNWIWKEMGVWTVSKNPPATHRRVMFFYEGSLYSIKVRVVLRVATDRVQVASIGYGFQFGFFWIWILCVCWCKDALMQDRKQELSPVLDSFR